MPNKNTKNVLYAFLAIVLVAMVGLFTVQLSAFGEETWLPEYFSGRCVEQPGSMSLVDVAKDDNKPHIYGCTTEAAPGYVPENSPDVNCEFEVQGVQQIYECEDKHTVSDFEFNTFSSNVIPSDCTDISDQVNSNPDTVQIGAGHYMYLDTGSVLGPLGSVAPLKARYPDYGIEYEGASGFEFPATESCALSSIQQEVHPVDKSEDAILAPKETFNAVTGLSPVKSNRVVTISGVNGGDPIYVTKPGMYAPVRESEDGFDYVDIQNEQQSDAIECIPGTTGCDNNAKIVELEQQPCDQFGGILSGYNPVEGQPNKLCKYDCQDGTLKVTDDCKTIPDDCPENTTYDPASNECVQVKEKKEETGELSRVTWILIIAFGTLAVILILVIVKMNMGNQRRARRPARIFRRR